MNDPVDPLDVEFEVHVKPRKAHVSHDGKTGCEHTVYDISAVDANNGNYLVGSRQGYENRQDAVELAEKLFRGRPAQLRIWNADLSLHESYRL